MPTRGVTGERSAVVKRSKPFTEEKDVHVHGETNHVNVDVLFPREPGERRDPLLLQHLWPP